MECFGKTSVQMEVCLKISNVIFASDALDCSFFFLRKSLSFPRILRIDVLTFNMSHTFRTVFFVL